MKRALAIVAVMTFAVPSVALAQHHDERHDHPNSHSNGPHGPSPHGPTTGPHANGPNGPHNNGPAGPHFTGPSGPHYNGPGGGGHFTYRGHDFNRVHIAPFFYPPGWTYRRWVIGAVLPPLFLVPSYYYADWAGLGLPPPPPGFQWVRYGPDLLLVNMATGQVADAVYDVFY